MNRFWIGAAALALTLGVVGSGPARAWDRGEVDVLTVLPDIGHNVKSSVEGLTVGPDGNIWFTEDVGKLGSITPDGVIHEYNLPDGANSIAGLTLGPDHNLWFTEDQADKVVRGVLGTGAAVAASPTPTASPTTGSSAKPSATATP